MLLRVARIHAIPTRAALTRTLHIRSFVRQESKPEEPKAEVKAEEGAKEPSPVETLMAQLAVKEAEITELKGKWMTSLADMENLRTRTRNDVDNAKKYGGQSVAKSMLMVADNITMALDAARNDATEEHPKLKAFFEGVEMTEKSLLSAFHENKITRMDSLGAKFDPKLHEGLFEFEDPSKTPGTVGQVMKAGYMLGDRVLRAASVGTIKAPPSSP